MSPHALSSRSSTSCLSRRLLCFSCWQINALCCWMQLPSPSSICVHCAVACSHPCPHAQPSSPLCLRTELRSAPQPSSARGDVPSIHRLHHCECRVPFPRLQTHKPLLQIHLFDIDIPGKITFRESDTLSPGEVFTVVDTPAGRLGIGICYDLRFPELAMVYRQRGVQLIIYPGVKCLPAVT